MRKEIKKRLKLLDAVIKETEELRKKGDKGKRYQELLKQYQVLMSKV